MNVARSAKIQMRVCMLMREERYCNKYILNSLLTFCKARYIQ